MKWKNAIKKMILKIFLSYTLSKMKIQEVNAKRPIISIKCLSYNSNAKLSIIKIVNNILNFLQKMHKIKKLQRYYPIINNRE